MTERARFGIMGKDILAQKETQLTGARTGLLSCPCSSRPKCHLDLGGASSQQSDLYVIVFCPMSQEKGEEYKQT